MRKRALKCQCRGAGEAAQQKRGRSTYRSAPLLLCCYWVTVLERTERWEILPLEDFGFLGYSSKATVLPQGKASMINPNPPKTIVNIPKPTEKFDELSPLVAEAMRLFNMAIFACQSSLVTLSQKSIDMGNLAESYTKDGARGKE